MPLTLEIVTPERRVAQVTCDEVRAPGTEGGFGIRPGHASFMSALEPGRLTLVTGATEEHYAIGGGFLQVENDRVVVLAEGAARRDEIDVAAIRQELAEATERLRRSIDGDEGRSAEAAKVRRATAWLTVAGG